MRLHSPCLLAVAAIVVTVAGTETALGELALPRASQKATLTQTVGFTQITVTYSRPAVKGRRIWGGLIAYDQVWRTGANEATTITFSTDVMVEGQKLAAGTYSLHTIPSTSRWTIIFNRSADQWGSFEYDPALDALRVQVLPTQSEPQELLTFAFPEVTENAAQLTIQWERLKVPIRIEVDSVGRAMKEIRNAMSTANANDWRVRLQSAEYAFAHKVAADESLQWIADSVAINANFENLALYARMLAANGDTRGAAAAAQRAIAAAEASPRRVDPAYIEDLRALSRTKQDR
jgi:Protein of unknown function (DUF2911)